VTVAFVGDCNNVARSLAPALPKSRHCFVPSHGYRFAARVREIQRHHGLTANPLTRSRIADVIYTDTWTRGARKRRAHKRRAIFSPYQIKVVNGYVCATTEGDFMHCSARFAFAATIDDTVMDGPQSVVYAQAENRLHAQRRRPVRACGCCL